ncbi:MAG: hypothetical protein NFW16_00555 [Candidatus Accumulibacter sp.]|uniref:hypothetical protein n=1 Tax=Accumulibacter sp. TaxID=2053492 RepID=UPI00258EFDF4|nr:hypothetical protein [Accumulibacter sp.]MCM8620243.1 hypothetical protein [Accumulibacter sp.]
MNRKFTGFTVSRNGAQLKVADQALDQLKERVRELTRRTGGPPSPSSSQSFESPCRFGKRTSESPRG